jgi:hypothetical protein
MDTNRSDTHVELTPLNMHGHADTWQESLSAAIRERDNAHADALAWERAYHGKTQQLLQSRADNERLRAALTKIQQWDALTAPVSHDDSWSDLPWLKRLVDDALERAKAD